MSVSMVISMTGAASGALPLLHLISSLSLPPSFFPPSLRPSPALAFSHTYSLSDTPTITHTRTSTRARTHTHKEYQRRALISRPSDSTHSGVPSWAARPPAYPPWPPAPPLPRPLRSSTHGANPPPPRPRPPASLLEHPPPHDCSGANPPPQSHRTLQPPPTWPHLPFSTPHFPLLPPARFIRVAAVLHRYTEGGAASRAQHAGCAGASSSSESRIRVADLSRRSDSQN